MKTRVTLIAVIPVLLLALALALPGRASAAQVGIKLGINGSGGLQNAASGALVATDVAGAPGLTQSNWNNCGRFGQVGPNNVKDANGSTTVVGIHWDCTGIWSEQGGGTPTAQTIPDNKLMNSYDDSNGNANSVPNDGTITTGVNIFGGSTVNNNKPWMHVTNLTAWLTGQGACSYDVVVYVEGDTAGRIGQYWVEAASGLGSSLTVGPNLTPFIFINGQTGFVPAGSPYTQVPATSSTGAAAVQGNYVVFPGLTADAILIRTEEYRPPGGTLRSPINAIQIVPHGMVAPTLPYPSPPSPQTNYGGATASFFVPAAGCSITYQWQAGAIGSGIYTNLTDGGNLWGSTTATLTITNLLVSQTADYVLVAANGSGSVQSTPISLYVQPQIITGPLTQEMLYPGMTAHFVTTVALTGTNNAYQWYKDNVALADGPSGSGAAITGSLNTNLTIAGVGGADVGNYWMVSSNFYGMTTSVVSHLSLLASPTHGSFAESVVTNAPLAYWRFDEVSGPVAFDNAGGLNGSYGANALPGQPGLQSPSFPGYPGFDSTNAAFGVSANADAWVTIPALNLNTNTVTFVAWVYNNANQQNWAGILTSRHAGTQAGFNFSGNRVNELSYTWDENNASTYGANVDIYVTNNVWTMVALVVTPTNASFYAADPAGGIRSANYGFGNNPELFFGPGTIGEDDTFGVGRAMNGQIDEVAVFNHALSPTTITWLYVAGTAAGVVPPPTIEVQPLPEEVYQGRPVSFSVVPAGLPPFSYQWRSNGVAMVNGGRVTGATNAAVTIANTQPSDAINYDVVVSNNGGSVTSSVVSLTLVAPTGAGYEAAVMAAGPVAYWRLNESSGTYAFDYYGGFTATYGSAPPSLGQPGPENPPFPGFEALNNAVLFTSGLAGSDVGAPPLNLNTNTVTIAAWINPSADQTTNFVGLVFQRQNLTTSGLGFGANNTHLGYNWNGAAADFNWESGLAVPANQWSFAALVIEPARATLYLYNANGQLVAAHAAPHAAQAFDGTTYIGVDPFYPNNVRGFNGTMDEVSIWNRALSGDQIAALYTAASGVTIPPTIALQPVPTTIYVGKTNTLTLTAAGTGPYAYQWYTNGVQLNDSSDIVGSTSNVLSFTNAALIDTANYSCVVTTALGRATSVVVSVTVLPVADSPVFTVSGNNSATFLNLTNQSGIVVGAEDFGATEYSFNVTNGALVTTYDFKVDGSVASVTGNGTITGTLNGTGTFGYTSGNTNFDNVLNEASNDGGPKTLTIKGLIPGRSYAVQMYPLDDRDSSGGQHREQSRRAYFQDPFNLTNLSSTFFMSNNLYVKATFTAASTNQTLIQQLPGWANGFTDLGNGNLNALVVRDASTTPAIQFQPLSASRYVRFPVTFNATVYGPVPLGYQWQKGSGGVFTNLSNSGTLTSPFPTNLSLAFPAVALTDAADYRLVLTNSSGSTTSQVATLTVLVASGGSYEAALLSYDPLAYWQLDETTGSLVAHDFAGGFDGNYQPNATNGLPGVPTPPFTGFPVTNACFEATMSLTNAWVTVPALNFNTNTVTFTAWLYPYSNLSTQADWAGILMTRASSSQSGIGYGGNNFSNANMLTYTWNGNSAATYGFLSGLTIPMSQWSFVAVAISPTNAALYLINASGIQTTNNAIAHTSQNWNGSANIGDDGGVARVFNGLVDEVAVFTRTLSPADITGLYNASPLAPPASAPTGLTATPGDAQVTLSWSGVAEASGYNIKRSTTSGSGYTTVANVGGTTFVNTNLLNGTNYFFVVSAVNFAGEGPNSTEASARPTSATPPQVVFGVNGAQIQLAWPGDHTGWLLQEQTNATGGLGTNWVVVPGSGTNNVFTVPINTSQASAFFRLVHP